MVISSRDQQGCNARAASINQRHPDSVVAIAARGDQETELRRLANRCVEELGGIDILVNNLRPTHFGPLLEADLRAWDKTFAVNVRGPFILTQAIVEAGMADHGGSIVNVASLGGIEPASRLGVYNLTKAALIHFTKQLARELGPQNICVNAVAPGLIKTKFAEAPARSARADRREPILRSHESATLVRSPPPLPSSLSMPPQLHHWSGLAGRWRGGTNRVSVAPEQRAAAAAACVVDRFQRFLSGPRELCDGRVRCAYAVPVLAAPALRERRAIGSRQHRDLRITARFYSLLALDLIAYHYAIADIGAEEVTKHQRRWCWCRRCVGHVGRTPGARYCRGGPLMVLGLVLVAGLSEPTPSASILSGVSRWAWGLR